jgi:hypothetical protein
MLRSGSDFLLSCNESNCFTPAAALFDPLCSLLLFTFRRAVVVLDLLLWQRASKPDAACSMQQALQLHLGLLINGLPSSVLGLLYLCDLLIGRQPLLVRLPVSLAPNFGAIIVHVHSRCRA